MSAEAIKKYGPQHPNWGAIFTNLDGKHDPIINIPEAVDALKFFKSLLPFAPSPLESDYPEATAYFMKGKCALNIIWASSFWDALTRKESEVRDKVACAVMPGGYGCIGGQGIGINKDSDNKEAAFIFIQWFTSKERDIINHVKAGTFPNRKSTYANPDNIAKYPYLKIWGEVQEKPILRPNIPESWPIYLSMWTNITDALAGTITPEEAMNKSQKEALEILGRA